MPSKDVMYVNYGWLKPIPMQKGNFLGMEMCIRDSSMVEELLDFQALAHAKAKTYCGYLQDQEAKEVMDRLTQTHQQCFDAINAYLQNRN